MTRQAQTATTGTTGEPSRRKAKTRRIRTTIRQVPFRLRDHRRKLHRYRHLLHPQREPLTGLLKDPVGRSLTPRGRDQLMAKAPAKTHGLRRPRHRRAVRRQGIEAVYAREVDNAEQKWENPARWKAAAFVREAEAARAQLESSGLGRSGRADLLQQPDD